MRSLSIRLSVLVCLCLVLAPRSAAAQDADPPRLQVGGYVQYDFLAPLGERADGEQVFRFRRVRLSLGGALGDDIDYLISVETTTTPMLRDAHVTLKHVPAVSLRVGQFIMPDGLEQFVFSSNSVAFTERIVTSLVASRDAGLMVFNLHPFGGWFSYAAAIANGTRQNVRDDNDAKDAMVRFTATPPAAPGLQLAVSAGRGEQPAGLRTRRGADVSFERKAFHVAAEFEREQLAGAPTRDGYYVFGVYRLHPDKVRSAFHHLEFGSRYGRVTGGEPFGQVEFAANYYVQPNVRFLCTYIISTDRAPGAARRTFHARANIRF